jgi:hypothetical protein
MTIMEIVREYLGKNGFDGLYNPGECACKKDELMPCDCISDINNCIPGYLCTQGDNEDMDGWNFHIGPNKETSPASAEGEGRRDD